MGRPRKAEECRHRIRHRGARQPRQLDLISLSSVPMQPGHHPGCLLRCAVTFTNPTLTEFVADSDITVGLATLEELIARRPSNAVARLFKPTLPFFGDASFPVIPTFPCSSLPISVARSMMTRRLICCIGSGVCRPPHSLLNLFPHALIPRASTRSARTCCSSPSRWRYSNATSVDYNCTVLNGSTSITHRPDIPPSILGEHTALVRAEYRPTDSHLPHFQ